MKKGLIAVVVAGLFAAGSVLAGVANVSVSPGCQVSISPLHPKTGQLTTFKINWSSGSDVAQAYWEMIFPGGFVVATSSAPSGSMSTTTPAPGIMEAELFTRSSIDHSSMTTCIAAVHAS